MKAKIANWFEGACQVVACLWFALFAIWYVGPLVYVLLGFLRWLVGLPLKAMGFEGIE